MALKTITGKLSGSSTELGGIVIITLSQSCVIAGTQEVVNVSVQPIVAADGTYTVQLQANNDLSPTGTYYTRRELVGSGSATFTFVVPQTAGPFVMSTLDAAPPVLSPPGALDSQVVHLANPETITGVKTYSVSPIIGAKFAFMPSGWDDAWRAAKAASGTTPTWVTLTGDSIAFGMDATTTLANTLFDLIKAGILARGYTLYGDYWAATYNPTLWASISLRLPTPTDFPFALGANGGAAVGNRASYGYNVIFSATGTPAGGFMSFTPPYNPSQLEIVLMDVWAAAATHQYNLDGGAPATFTPNGAGGSLDRQRRITLAGLSNASHTLNWTQQTTTFTMQIAGVVAKPYPLPTTGIGFCRNAWPGGSMADIGTQQSASGVPVDKIGKLYSNQKFDGTQGFGMPMGAALNIIMLGENDATLPYVNCGPDVYRRHLYRLITSLRQGYSNGSILLVASSIPDVTLSDFTSYGANQNPENWYHYRQAMQMAAADLNCGFLDMQMKPSWSPNPVAAGLMLNDGDPHPTNAGQADIADTILAVI